MWRAVALLLLAGFASEGSAAAGGGIEEMIRRDPALAALDRRMAEVYAAASKKTPPAAKAEQHGWVKRRDDCWKAEDEVACVRDAYRRRIAELQARFRLVPSKGPFTWQCDDNAASEFAVTFFETDPATLIAEHAGETSLMYQAPSGSGARYEGRNESYWEHRGEATIRWGDDAPELRCRSLR
ncbi:MAG: MliC family protein [bacterium]|nr:MliC family protein [bacterium]